MRPVTPTLHGTGLEDYFSGAWYYFGIFDLPLHGLVEKAAMSTDQYRFHLLDAVPFKRKFFLQFEFGKGNLSKGYMSSTSYWYQDPPVGTDRPLPPVALRYPPDDPLAHGKIMARIFEHERIGHLEEARDRCLVYTQRFPGHTYTDIIRLRAQAYEEVLADQPIGQDAYTPWTTDAPASPAVQQAKALSWFYENPEHALLGAHARGPYKVYVDGKFGCSGSRICTTERLYLNGIARRA